jgi:hypothetical protein
VCCAAGLAVLDEIERLSLMSHARDVGKHLKSRLADLAETADGALIGQVRGTGLFLGIEFVRDRQTHEPATEETSWLCSRLKVSRHARAYAHPHKCVHTHTHTHAHTHTHTHTHTYIHTHTRAYPLTKFYPSHTYTRLRSCRTTTAFSRLWMEYTTTSWL